MTSEKKLWVALIAVAILALGGYYYPTVKSSVETAFGGVTNYDEVDATAIKIGGANGTRIGPIMTGVCSLILPSYTVAASTTIAADCAITGVVATDGVFAQLASSTQIGLGGWSIRGASASSTAGFITVSLVNGTGASNLIPASLASTTKYIVLRVPTSVPGL